MNDVAESKHFERVTFLTTLRTQNVMNLAAVVKKRKVAAVSAAEVSKKGLQSSQTRQRPARANTSTDVIFRGNPTKGVKCSLPARRVEGIVEVNLNEIKKDKERQERRVGLKTKTASAQVYR